MRVHLVFYSWMVFQVKWVLHENKMIIWKKNWLVVGPKCSKILASINLLWVKWVLHDDKNNDHLKKKFFVCSWSWVLKNITQYLFCYGVKTPFEEVVMLKIDCNFSWHGNQVVTAWSTATVLYMYGREQLHNDGPFSCRNLYLDCCRIAAVMFSLTL